MASIEHHSSRQQRALSEEVGALEEDKEPDLGDLLGLPPVPVRERYPSGRHKRTKALRKATLVSAQYLLAAYGNPIETMLQMASLPVEELAARLRISLHEAWIERRLLLAMAAPYLVPRMPQGVAILPMTGVDMDNLGTALGPIFAATNEPAPDESGEDGASHPGMAPGANGFDDSQLRARFAREAEAFTGETIEGLATIVVNGAGGAVAPGVSDPTLPAAGPAVKNGEDAFGDLFGPVPARDTPSDR
jgi:hypothetical protein